MGVVRGRFERGEVVVGKRHRTLCWQFFYENNMIDNVCEG